MKSHVRFRGVWHNADGREQVEEIVCACLNILLWQDISKKEYWAMISNTSNAYKLDKLEYERVAKLLSEDSGIDDETPERKMEDPMEQMDV